MVPQVGFEPTNLASKTNTVTNYVTGALFAVIVIPIRWSVIEKYLVVDEH